MGGQPPVNARRVGGKHNTVKQADSDFGGRCLRKSRGIPEAWSRLCVLSGPFPHDLCHGQDSPCWLPAVLTIWWSPCVESSPVLLEEGVCYDQCILLAKLSLCPASFCIPRSNLPVTPGISWFLTFAFQAPMMKTTSLCVCVCVCVSSRSCRSS